MDTIVAMYINHAAPSDSPASPSHVATPSLVTDRKKKVAEPKKEMTPMERAI
jgi:hypothetical protein